MLNTKNDIMSRRLFRRMKNKNYRKHYQYLIIMFNRIKSSTLRGMATVVAAIVLFVSFSAAARPRTGQDP